MAAVSVAVALASDSVSRIQVLQDAAGNSGARFGSTVQAYTRCLLNKWYVDELYDALFVNRAKDAGKRLVEI